MAAAYEELGHRVTRIEAEDTTWPALIARVLDEGLEAVTFTARPLKDERGYHPRPHLMHTLRESVPTWSYHLDIYRGLRRGSDVGRDGWWNARHVFTADGGSPPEFWQYYGVNHRWMQPAVHGPAIKRGTPRPEWLTFVGFVGTGKGYHSEWPYRRELLKWLRDTYGREFRHHPEDGGRIHGDALNDLYASTIVVVGDTFCPEFVHPFYWSDRVYETVGRGGLLIHPHITGLGADMVHGEHLLTYRYGDYIKLRELIDLAHRDHELRDRIITCGMEHVRLNHTYRHRAAAMLEVVMA